MVVSTAQSADMACITSEVEYHTIVYLIGYVVVSTMVSQIVEHVATEVR